jgi:hypothetical protein
MVTFVRLFLASDGSKDGDQGDSDGNFYEGKCALALFSVPHLQKL